MAYLLDNNIFITAKNQLPADVWPTFWQRISELIQHGKIFTSTKVREEIERGEDELTLWLKQNHVAGFYIEPDAEVLNKYAATIAWANGSSVFSDTARNEYASVADSFLVATAAAKGMVLVTFEKSNPQSKRRVMIPDACLAIGVSCCDLNTALRQLNVVI